MPDSALSLRPGSSATSSWQHPKVSGPVVSTERVVEQLLSPDIAPGLDTQQWAMRTQAGRWIHDWHVGHRKKGLWL